MLIVLVACGSTTTIPIANPVRPEGDCSAAPAGERSLLTRVEVERGEAAIEIDGEKRPGCALWKMPPGTHHVTITASGAGGFGLRARMQVADPPNVYDLFDLSCGLPGSCDTQTLRSWEAAVVADRTRMTDPCGAAKLTGIRWSTEMLDDVHPKQVELGFDLHVYMKASGKPPHDPTCPEK